MGELVVSLILGLWITAGGWLAYRSLKKDVFDEGDA